MKKITLLLTFFCCVLVLHAQVRLADIFSDNMVLQANQKIKVWGFAPAGEKVKVLLGNQTKTTTTNKSGTWMVEFSPLNYGEKLEMKVTGRKNECVVSNILTGDVWFCSGQSNMAMTINGDGGQVYNYKNVESEANYPAIRSFKVKPNISAKSGVEANGTWEVCTPQTVSNYSAVAYFFAREIHEKTGIPIGIINSSWGGTDIETWMSMDTFGALPEHFRRKYNQAAVSDIEDILKNNDKNQKVFEELVANDPGTKEKWYETALADESWDLITVPKEWSSTNLSSFDGVVWLKYDFMVADKDAGIEALLSLGKVDDNDMTWINGIKVGETRGAGVDRFYTIPQGVLKKGKNTIIIKVIDVVREGGLTGKPEELFIEIADGKYRLAGEWHYKKSIETNGISYEEFTPNLYYGLLYNAMVEPLINYAIKGVIWYQGENNAGQAYDYRTLFPTLIQDWRSKWGYEFPFYWVQLASYKQKALTPPKTDSWAELREAQNMTLSVNKTGQAIITDIGDANDIHPKNKQDVGKRLAFIVLNKDYGLKDIVYSGPTFKESRVEKDRVVVTFDQVASGLHVTNKYGYIEGFTIAGEDQRFVWAKAYLDGTDMVVVYSDQVKNPVAVRYGWSINPDVNLFNSAGLPAAPFRTDNWKISSEK